MAHAEKVGLKRLIAVVGPSKVFGLASSNEKYCRIASLPARLVYASVVGAGEAAAATA